MTISSGVAIPVSAMSLGSQDNLEHVFAMATAQDIAAGLDWYPSAQRICFRISREHNVPVLRVVRAMAALSPRCNWSNNIRALERVAELFFAGTPYPVYPGTTKGIKQLAKQLPSSFGLPVVRENILKAFWELSGHEVLTGPKVSSFARNILNPDESDDVTVDSHHVMAWLGILASGSYQFSGLWYERIAQDTRNAAAKYGYSPLVFQAIVWVTKRRVQNLTSAQAVAIWSE